MPRIKRRVADSPLFKQAATHSRELGEHNACAPIAVSLITGVPIDKVHELFYAHGRRRRQGTPQIITRRVLEDLGYRMVAMPIIEKLELIRSYPGKHRNLHYPTTYHPVRFAKAWERYKDTPMLLMTETHICAFMDGKVHDWSECRALRIKTLYRVIKN